MSTLQPGLRQRRSRRFAARLAALGLLLCVAAPVAAVPVTWNVAGSGTWDLVTGNWTGGVPTPSLYVNGDAATFNNTAGGTITLAGVIAPLSTTVSATSGTYTFTGTGITSGSLLKSGGGALIMNNANTYAGGTTIAAASGQVTATVNATQNSIGTGAASIGAGSTLQLNNTNTTTNTTIGNTFTGTGGILKLNFAAGATARNTTMANVTGFDGTIQLSNSGATGDKWNVAGINAPNAIVQVDSGSQLFINTSASTFERVDIIGTGNTENRGALRLTNTLNAPISLLGSASIGTEGGTINGNISSGAVGTQTLTFGTGSSTGNATINGIIGGGTGTIAVTKTQAGLVILNGNNTYTGGTTISAGTLEVQGTYATPTYTIASGAVLELDTGAANKSYSSTSFSGAGTLRKTGTAQALWGASAATFAMTSGSLIDIQQGEFVGGSSANENWVNNFSDLNIAAGATFTGVEANVRVDALTGAGTLKTGFTGAGYANFTIGVDNGTGTFTGTIQNASATGNIVKLGSGVQTLAGNNTYTGTTTVNGGTLELQGTYASSSHSIASGAVLELDTGAANKSYATTSFSGAGTLRKTGTSQAVWGASAATFAMTSGSLIDIQQGEFVGGSSANENWVNNFSDLNIAAGATFGGVEANVRVDALTGGGTLRTGYTGSGYSTFTVGVDNGSGTFTGTIENSVGHVGNFAKAGTGIQTLSGVNTYTGITAINGGTLALGSTGTIDNSPTINVATGATFDVSAVSGYDLLSTQTLRGGGSIDGNVITNAGSIISPGASAGAIGTLSFLDNLDINGTLLIDINGAGAGTTDLINVAGLLDITQATLDFDLVGPINDPFYIFASYGTLTGQFASITGQTASGYVINYNFQGNKIALVMIPEPATMSLLALGSLGLLRRRRSVC